MDNRIAYLRHYIYINQKNIYEDLNNNEMLKSIKLIHNSNYNSGEIVKYYGYNDIATLLKNFDEELYDLFLQINYNYPALLADLGRMIILYNYGGVYHDLKCMSNKNMINYLTNLSEDIELIGEEHPRPDLSYRVRTTNIIALKPKSMFLYNILQKMKTSLINSKDAVGGKSVFNIGSKIYIDEFTKNKNVNIYKYPFVKNNMIIFHMGIYSKREFKWQCTEESIFRK